MSKSRGSWDSPRIDHAIVRSEAAELDARTVLQKTHNVHSLRNDVGGCRIEALAEVEREQRAQLSDAKQLTVESCTS